MASTTIIDSYSVGFNNATIKLNVIIEHAQMAKSTVRLNKKAVGEFQDSFSLELGKANDLMGCILYIDTTEADINPDTDLTGFKLELNGGPAPYINQRSQTVSKGGFVVYTVEIALIP
jgi:hypothetical protein